MAKKESVGRGISLSDSRKHLVARIKEKEDEADRLLEAGDVKKAAYQYGDAYHTARRCYPDISRGEVERLEGKYKTARERLLEAIRRKSSLDRISIILVTIFAIIGGIFFLSSNITGNAIGNITNSTSSIIGAVLLVVGIVGGFFWINSRKQT